MVNARHRNYQHVPRLVRWRIPRLMCLDGEHPVTEWVTGERLFDCLLDKLAEEAGEICAAKSVEHIIEECGDAEQVIRAILRERNIAWGWLDLNVKGDAVNRKQLLEMANVIRRAGPHEYKILLERALRMLGCFYASANIDPREVERVRLVKLNEKGDFVRERLGLVLVRVLRTELLEAA